MAYFKNIVKVFSDYRYVLFFLSLFALMYILFEYLTDDALIKGNLGIVYFYANFLIQVLISVLFALFLTFFVYKYIAFSTFDKNGSVTSFVGTFVGILVGGCAACSLTVASYLGLGAFLVFLPYHGIELKIVSLLMLVYANVISVRDLEVCRINFSQK